MIRQKAFYEWAMVHNHLYGTQRRVVDAEIQKGRDVLFDIDVQGGLNIKRQRPESVLIFLLPPSMSVLETRLRGRKSDSDDVIAVRLRNSRQEMAHALQYDYVLVNDDLDRAVDSVRAIIAAERARSSRLVISSDGEDLRVLTGGLFESDPQLQKDADTEF